MSFKKNITLFALFFLLALMPRLFFLFLHDGQCDAKTTVELARQFYETGLYSSNRAPGAPFYELTIGLIDRLFKNTGFPYFYYTNVFSVICLTVTLLFLFLIFKKYLSFQKSLLGILLFNFYPQTYVIAASTYDLNLMIALSTAAFYAFTQQKIYLAIVLAFLGMSAKFFGVILAIPLCIILVKKDLIEKKYSRLAFHLLMVGLFAVSVYLPLFFITSPLQILTSFLSPPYHQDLLWIQLRGAFVHRTINALGPAGFFILVFAIFKNRQLLHKLPSNFMFILFSMVFFNLLMMYKMPAETYYLLPLVPVVIFTILKLPLHRLITVAFILSFLLPNFIQIQVKPWKWPPYLIRKGVVKAHIEKDWHARGGG